MSTKKSKRSSRSQASPSQQHAHHPDNQNDHQGHGHHHHFPHHGGLKQIRLAFFLNLFFTFVEIWGGLWSGSVAVLADAVHDLGDSLSLALAFYLEKQSQKSSNATYTYGLRRLSLLSAFITGLVLCLGSAVIAVQAIHKWMDPSRAPHSLGMMGLAFLGLFVNGWAAWKLLKGRTHNERVLSWHFIEDVMGWAAVLVGAIVIHFLGWSWVDPVLALGIAGFVGWNALKNLLQTTMVFLQSSPADLDQRELKNRLCQVPGVSEIHDLHVWSLDGAHHVMTMHAVVADMSSVADIKMQLRKIAGEFGATFTTIEIELDHEECAENCDEVLR